MKEFAIYALAECSKELNTGNFFPAHLMKYDTVVLRNHAVHGYPAGCMRGRRINICAPGASPNV
jgi:hypothetical protein